MRKKIASILILATLLVTSLGACGSDGSDGTVTPEPTATAAPTATPEPTEPPTPTPEPTATPVPFDKSVTLMNTYGTVFDYSGVCVSSASLLDNIYTVKSIKQHYNSVTLENEMMPSYILGNAPKLVTVDEAKALGYVIPDNYADTMVPVLNFDTTDLAMRLCTENGLGLRFHTLVWHSQSPNWFFRSDYSYDSAFVTPEVMDARLEFYIRTVMKHVYDSEYGACVYAWDVVNEYLNADASNWIAIYGQKNTSPAFVKLAYQIADEVLRDYGIRENVSLIFNDFNTYNNTPNLIKVLDFLNAEQRICDGMGMQAHLDTNYPDPLRFKQTVKAFLDAGYEVQLTELDVTCKRDSVQANYYYNLMKGLLELKKDGGNITGITYWGRGDDHSWRSDGTPLLFSMPGKPKEAYYKVLQAYVDSGYTIQE